MAKKRKRKPQPEPEQGSNISTSNETKDNRTKMRALIISALAAGGVFQMNSWQIQAHGNRSSHSALAFQTPSISPDDYVLLRQVLTGPRTGETDQLAEISRQLRALGGANNMEALTASHQKLLSQKRTIEQKLGLPSTTRQVIQFLKQGDSDAAVATIEGQGWPERVLQDYQWTLLDIAYLDEGNGQKFTANQQKHFLAIAKPSARYSDKVLAVTRGRTLTAQELASKDRVAEILHNIASFIVLMDDADAATLDFGQQAAENALKVRMELNKADTIMRANWMVAQYHIRANRTDQAIKFLTTSLQQAEQLKDTPGIAWAKFSMAQALRKSQAKSLTMSAASRNTRAAKLESETNQLVSQFKGQDTTIDFLRIQLRK